MEGNRKKTQNIKKKKKKVVYNLNSSNMKEENEMAIENVQAIQVRRGDQEKDESIILIPFAENNLLLNKISIIKEDVKEEDKEENVAANSDDEQTKIIAKKRKNRKNKTAKSNNVKDEKAKEEDKEGKNCDSQEQDSSNKIKEENNVEKAAADNATSLDEDKNEEKKVEIPDDLKMPLIMHPIVFARVYQHAKTAPEKEVILAFDEFLANDVNRTMTQSDPNRVIIFCFQHINEPAFLPLGSIFYFNMPPIDKIVTIIKAFIIDLRSCGLKVVCTLSTARPVFRAVICEILGVPILPSNRALKFQMKGLPFIAHLFCPEILMGHLKSHLFNHQLQYIAPNGVEYVASIEALKCAYRSQLREENKEYFEYPDCFLSSASYYEEAKELFSSDMFHIASRYKCKGHFRLSSHRNASPIVWFFYMLWINFENPNQTNEPELPYMESADYQYWRRAYKTIKHMTFHRFEYLTKDKKHVDAGVLKTLLNMKTIKNEALRKYTKSEDRSLIFDRLHCDTLHFNFDLEGNYDRHEYTYWGFYGDDLQPEKKTITYVYLNGRLTRVHDPNPYDEDEEEEEVEDGEENEILKNNDIKYVKRVVEKSTKPGDRKIEQDELESLNERMNLFDLYQIQPILEKDDDETRGRYRHPDNLSLRRMTNKLENFKNMIAEGRQIHTVEEYSITDAEHNFLKALAKFEDRHKEIDVSRICEFEYLPFTLTGMGINCLTMASLMTYLKDTLKYPSVRGKSFSVNNLRKLVEFIRMQNADGHYYAAYYYNADAPMIDSQIGKIAMSKEASIFLKTEQY